MQLLPSRTIWFNGELVPWDEARVHVLAHALHYGSSVFEGLRAYATRHGPAIFGLDEHVRRLLHSCAIVRLPLPWDAGAVREAILATVRANGHEACYIRPIAFRGYGALGIGPEECPVEFAIATFPWNRPNDREVRELGLDLGVSSWRRMAPDTHPAMAKAGGNYLNSQLVWLEARRHGYADGLVLDVDGYLSEGSGQNVFLVAEGEVRTPPVGSSILAGITRRCAIEISADLGYAVREARLPREMLYTCEEAFLTGTVAEITPVRSIDGHTIGEGRRGPITEQIQTRFFQLVRGEVEDGRGWLTPV